MATHTTPPVPSGETAGTPQERGQQLAAGHRRVTVSDRQTVLLERLERHAQTLKRAHEQFETLSSAELPYAAEWILDNYYLIQQAILEVRKDLPKGYYRELPRVEDPAGTAPLPRVYTIADSLIRDFGGELNVEAVSAFVQAYQEVAPLTMGELWAVPLMLRMATLASMAAAAQRIVDAADPAKARRVAPTRQRDDMIVADGVRTLRMLAVQDWNEFFEHVSRVEQTLRRDPAGVHDRSDFETRDRCRKAVEELARRTGLAEEEVARLAVSLAEAHSDPGQIETRQGHTGFYLLDAGRLELERTLGYRPPLPQKLRRMVRRHALLFYLGSIGSLTVALLAAVLAYLSARDGSAATLAGSALLLLVPAATVAVSVVNWLVTHIFRPTVLPKLDFRRAIPNQESGIVVIPALLSDDREVDSLLGQLERHYLANGDPSLRFVLLGDFCDAPQKNMPADHELLLRANQGIEALNEKYAAVAQTRFSLLQRERRWNPREDCWMGWERKRGKLHEFNRLLRGARDTSYYPVRSGELESLTSARYVITLDADTILPSGNAHRLIGTLAHPLNRPRLDEHGRLRAGYTLLQPRAEIKPTSANRSWFARLFGGESGLDPYTHAVSDVYQDLFGNGIFVGKGIYDIDAFEATLSGRIPENALLSHDLFEGLHGRVGLVTDITVLEDFPSHFLAYTRRAHRWVRGDWQLLPWLFGSVPHATGPRIRNQLSVLDRWKIVDNLRRSLLAPSLVAWLISAWLFLPGSAWLLTALAAVAVAAPVLLSLLDELHREPSGITERLPGRDALRWLLTLAFLAYEAAVDIDAIVTTLVRMLFTRKRLLQWTPAAHTARLLGNVPDAEVIWTQMASSVVFVAILAAVIAFEAPGSLLAAAPFLAAWLLSPELARRISRPARRRKEEITEDQRRLLRRLARRTWLFFEQFVGPEDNWLPPDNYQESPLGVVAHRTSPTNIGMLILSTLAAYEMGYIGSFDLTIRIRSLLDTIDRLERYRGHLLNWYDTRTLQPLAPRYVSTVDSGNLAAALIVLREAYLDLPEHLVLRSERWDGLADTFDLLAETVRKLYTRGEQPAQALLAHLESMRKLALQAKDDVAQWVPSLSRLNRADWQHLDELLRTSIESSAHGLDFSILRDLRAFSHTARRQLNTMQRRLGRFLPWLPMLERPPELLRPPHAGGPLPSATAGAWQSVRSFLNVVPTMRSLPQVAGQGRAALQQLQSTLEAAAGTSRQKEDARAWCARVAGALASAAAAAESLLPDYDDVAQRAEAIVRETDFAFLFERQRELFHIGYNVDSGMLDGNYYDLLASESRIASYIAIAKGEVPHSHWMKLGRPLTRVAGKSVLLSWSGTMFEYLMAGLWMESYPDTLLYESEETAVRYQQGLFGDSSLPWGISESGYYRFDATRNYQYRAFGAPGLGLKRGLADDRVVTPYASLLALPWSAGDVAHNVERLTALDMMGRYGLYEAIDFTPSRVPRGRKYAQVCSFMSHHQGMILVSIANFLRDRITIRRFHRDPRIRTNELLLQEQLPRSVPLQTVSAEAPRTARVVRTETALAPWPAPEDAPVPLVHVLSNGSYGVMVTAAGAGFSYWRQVDLTRWRPDTTLDEWGNWIYVKDNATGDLWSITLQPAGGEAEVRETVFEGHTVRFRRRSHLIMTRTEIAVSPEDDVEVRRVTLVNEGGETRTLSVADYAEVVLGSQASDDRHPAFSKLFVESEYVDADNALVFHRRPRSEEDTPVYLAHALSVDAAEAGAVKFETDRLKFLGRGRTLRAPAAMQARGLGLSGTAGATLDPIMCLGVEIELEPHGSVQLLYATAAAKTRAEALALLRRHRTRHAVEVAFNQARHQSEVEARQLGLDSPQLQSVQRLLSALLYPGPALRPDPAVLASNNRGQPSLWAFGISGDYPIVLARVPNLDRTELVAELLRAHAYWRNRQLKITLVLLNEHDKGYRQELYDQLTRLVTESESETWLNRHDGIFILRADQLSEEECTLLQTAARAVLNAEAGSLSEQTARIFHSPAGLPAFIAGPPAAADLDRVRRLVRPDDLLFDNGTGGFSRDGREYVMFLEQSRWTPAPWINVIANPDFGFTISESGGGYTWAHNSGENRLTSWQNDPVRDTPSEAVYLRDEETGEIWSPTPLPVRAAEPYLIRHGCGYTIMEHISHGLQQRGRWFVAGREPVKIVQLRIENLLSRPRRLTATYYAEWVLGTTRDLNQQFLIPEFEAETRALFVRNPYNPDFPAHIAFLAANKEPHGLTADRTEFLGRMGGPDRPAALARIGLASRVQPGTDVCGAIQLHLDLAPGQSEEIYFILGEASSREEACTLVKKFQSPRQVESAWEETTGFWDTTLSAVAVQTPDPGMDLMLNRWLLYQALSCRIWGRSALYQSSGAFGYRDQLQDVMALTHALPQLERQHILEAARHQFEAGDALHWWHPPSGRGVRTRCSDDLLWLPYVTAHYVNSTGDHGILDEQIAFLKGAPLKPDELERYAQWTSADGTHTLYEHCMRAIGKGSTAGPHRLPLIGTGDWNDGFSHVGVEGFGESVWLGWFLFAVLQQFARLCDLRGDASRAAAYRKQGGDLRAALETHAWDGGWYRRAYYDDRSPMGSAANRECRIDSIAQSWAVLSGAGDPNRSRQGMQAVEKHLVRRDARQVLLFTPPFDRTIREPGYIKAYPPGIRENGGQYTHAALWTAWAFSTLGDGGKAAELFHLLNPVTHTSDAEGVSRYRIEPYVVAADVYSVPPHVGRGGWSWYTGSASWMYRLGIEAILGLRRAGASLRVDPCIPPAWDAYRIVYRYGRASYSIAVENPAHVSRGVKKLVLDGQAIDPAAIPLQDDGRAHDVVVEMG